MTEVPCSAVELATRGAVYRRGHGVSGDGEIVCCCASPGGGGRVGPATAPHTRSRPAGDRRGRRGAAAGATVPGGHGRRGDAPHGPVSPVVLRLLQGSP